MWYMNVNVYFFKIFRDFFKKIWVYVAFCAYRPILIRVAGTDPSQCPPNRRPRPRLWTMVDIASRTYIKTHEPVQLFSIISYMQQCTMWTIMSIASNCLSLFLSSDSRDVSTSSFTRNPSLKRQSYVQFKKNMQVWNNMVQQSSNNLSLDTTALH